MKIDVAIYENQKFKVGNEKFDVMIKTRAISARPIGEKDTLDYLLAAGVSIGMSDRCLPDNIFRKGFICKDEDTGEEWYVDEETFKREYEA
ncbi:MAG TPA: hypothetical protein ENK52_01045 [Saprospiraceae bacterium]|nr:hypothetical protein [Saprospiraceae bacterium]